MIGSSSGHKRACLLHARELSRNQSILRFDVTLQHDWPIEQCLLRIRVFFRGKTKKPCFDLFIHWLIKQITNSCRNHFSRSYENHSIVKSTCASGTKEETRERASPLVYAFDSCAARFPRPLMESLFAGWRNI